jgi:TonB family protein
MDRYLRVIGALLLSAVVAAVLCLPAGTGTARAGDEITPPKPIPSCMVQPVYPEAEKKAGIQGTVFLNVEVKADGTVGEVTPKKEVKGHPAFTASATAAIQTWCFEPGQKDGNAVDVQVVIPVRFALDCNKKK